MTATFLTYACFRWRGSPSRSKSFLVLQCWSKAKPARSAYMIQHAREDNTIYKRGFFFVLYIASSYLYAITNSLHVSFSFLQYYDARALRVSYLSFESLQLTLRNKPTKNKACMPVSPFVHSLCCLIKRKHMIRILIRTTSTTLFRGDLGETLYNPAAACL